MKKQRTRLSCFAVILFTISMLPLLAAAQDELGIVMGTVLNDGGPATGVRVVVISSGVSSYEGAALTDQNGQFSVSGVPLGTLSLRVYGENDKFLGERNAILIEDGETTSLVINVSSP